MYRYLLILLILELLKGEFNSTLLDIYHKKISKILIETSENVDNFFIDNNYSHAKNRTEAQLKTSFAIEDGKKAEYALHLRLRLHLPKLQNKFKLIFEDEDSDNIFYDSLKLDNQYKLENKGYFLRLDYFNYVIKKIDFTSGIGLKFKKFNIYPYVNLKTKYIFKRNNILIKIDLDYIPMGKYRDTVTLSKIRALSDYRLPSF